MDYGEIKLQLTRFSRLVADKQYNEADKLAQKLLRSGMTLHDFEVNTTKEERAKMRAWKMRQRRSAPKINQPTYKYYVVQLDKFKDGPERILSGWDFREDAKDALEDLTYGDEYDKKELKVYTGTYLKKNQLDPNQNVNWQGG